MRPRSGDSKEPTVHSSTITIPLRKGSQTRDSLIALLNGTDPSINVSFHSFFFFVRILLDCLGVLSFIKNLWKFLENCLRKYVKIFDEFVFTGFVSYTGHLVVRFYMSRSCKVSSRYTQNVGPLSLQDVLKFFASLYQISNPLFLFRYPGCFNILFSVEFWIDWRLQSCLYRN